MLTATMPVKGLQVGDILRVTYSVDAQRSRCSRATCSRLRPRCSPTRRRSASAGSACCGRRGQDVRWKALAKTGDAKVRQASAASDELSVATPLPKQPDLPNDAPARFHAAAPGRAVDLQATGPTYRGRWPRCSPPVAFAPGSPLAAEAARIKAAASDPLARTALALESVQGNVRYLFNGLDHGNYVPQPPEKTWAIRSGDCKAKTLLLLSLLKALDITAEPMLAHTRSFGDFLRRPAAVGGGVQPHPRRRDGRGPKTYWLDGTGPRHAPRRSG